MRISCTIRQHYIAVCQLNHWKVRVLYVCVRIGARAPISLLTCIFLQMLNTLLLDLHIVYHVKKKLQPTVEQFTARTYCDLVTNKPSNYGKSLNLYVIMHLIITAVNPSFRIQSAMQYPLHAPKSQIIYAFISLLNAISICKSNYKS